jgi:ferredoxin-NADP reductase
VSGDGAPSRWLEALIDRVVRRTPRVVSIFLRVPFGPFEAGQHVDVRLTAPDGYQAQRSYSIASAPGASEIELAIERLDDGEVSPYFFDVATAGDTIEVRGPIGGHFIWRASDGGPLLLLGGGSGIVPLVSMLRHRAAVAPATKALLAYSVRTWDDVIFRDELIEQASHDDGVRLVLATTRGPSPRGEDFARRFDREALREVLARWGVAPRHAYVCGSTPFVEAIASQLVAEGIAPQRIRAERYGG